MSAAALQAEDKTPPAASGAAAAVTEAKPTPADSAKTGESKPAAAPVTAAWPAEKPLPRLTILDRTTEPVLRAEKPWEDFIVNYARVLGIGQVWHMWYNSYDHTYKNDADVFLCYARSDDGLHWTRPNLGLVDYAGSKDNNIIARDILVPAVFLDEASAPEERYKIVRLELNRKNSCWEIFGGTSPDGLHWNRTGQLMPGNSDTDNVCFRDGDLYRLYVRMWSDGLYKGKRQVGYTESKTFGNFPPPRVILEADRDDPADMDFYNSAATKLMRGLYVMFPSAFYRSSQTVVPHAALSRDGVKFERVGRRPVLALGQGFDSKCIYVGAGLVPAERPGEYWFYYLGENIGHDDNSPAKNHFGGGIGRFKLRLEEPAASVNPGR
jgi:hypothetical protein